MTTSYLLYITIIPETSSGTIWKTQKGTSWININTVLLLTMTDARERFSISVDGSRP
jgi:riboflavin synthase alpha subunit